MSSWPQFAGSGPARRSLSACAGRRPASVPPLLLSLLPFKPGSCSAGDAHTPPARTPCVQYTVTAWGKDPYSLGSYSFTKSAPGGDYAKVHTE